MGERADYVSTSHVRADSGSNGASGSGSNSDPDAIAADIEQTREEMSETIEAIQERLDPEQLSQQATEVTEQAREAAKDVAKYAIEEAKAAVNEMTRARPRPPYARQRLGSSIWPCTREIPPRACAAISGPPSSATRYRPRWQRSGSAGSGRTVRVVNRSGRAMPGMAITGRDPFGLELSILWRRIALLRFVRDRGWLRFVGTIGGYGSSGTHGRQYDQQGGQGQQMGGQIVGQAQGELAGCRKRPARSSGQAGQVVGQVARSSVRCRTRCAGGRSGAAAGPGFWQMMETERSRSVLLAVLGGVAGLLIPETEKEHQLMGETRDRVIGSVQEMAGETVAKAQRVAEEAGRSAMEAGQAAIEEVNSQQGSTGQSGSGERKKRQRLRGVIGLVQAGRRPTIGVQALVSTSGLRAHRSPQPAHSGEGGGFAIWQQTLLRPCYPPSMGLVATNGPIDRYLRSL